MLVAEHLNFDVARIDDELFDEHPVIAERSLGFGLGGRCGGGRGSSCGLGFFLLGGRSGGLGEGANGEEASDQGGDELVHFKSP